MIGAGWTRFLLVGAFVLATSIWAGSMLRRLNGVRGQEAAMRASPAGPRTKAAVADPVATVRATLDRHGVQVSRLAAAGRQSGAGRIMVAFSGPERALRGALAALEGASPAIRFSEWRMSPEPGAADRLLFDAVGMSAVVAVQRVVEAAPRRRLFGGGLDDPAIADVAAGAGGDAPVVVGIVGRLPDAAVALVRDADGRSRSVAVGGESGGWRLEGLTADRAVFSRGGERIGVRLASE